MGTTFYILILQLQQLQPKGLWFESRQASRQASVFKNFFNQPYIDQATHPQISKTKLLESSHHGAHLILNFKIPFLIFKFQFKHIYIFSNHHDCAYKHS